MKKKILIFTNNFLPSTGGGPIYYEVLTRLNNDKTFFILTGKYKRKFIYKKENKIIYSFLPSMEYFRYNRFTEFFYLILSTMLSIPLLFYLAILKKTEIIQTVFSWTILPSFIVSKVLKRKLILDVRGISDFENREKLLKFIFKIKKPDLVVYNAEKSLEFLKKNFRDNRKFFKSLYIPNFPFFERKKQDNKRFRVFKKNSKKIRFLFVGRLQERKGILCLLNAFKKISENRENIELIIIGSGRLYHKIKNETKDDKNIFLIKEVPHFQMPRFYRASDVFVLPSFSEAQPRSIIEALYFNIPIISTKVGDIPKIIKDGINGIVIKPKSEYALFHALKKIIHNKLYLQFSNNIKKDKTSLSGSSNKIKIKIRELYNLI